MQNSNSTWHETSPCISSASELDYWVCTAKWIFSGPTFLSLMGMAGLALIAISIPVALYLFGGKEKERDYNALDSYILSVEVFQAGVFPSCVALIFGPLIFWKVDPFIMFYFWGAGICLMVKTLWDVYSLMDNTTAYKKRLDFLQKPILASKSEKIWHSVWGTKNIPRENEKEFLKAFATSIEFLLEGRKENWQMVINLLASFRDTIDNRSREFFTREDTFSVFLGWGYTFWCKDRRINFAPTEAILHKTINVVFTDAILLNHFFTYLTKHLREKKNNRLYARYVRYVTDIIFAGIVSCFEKTGRVSLVVFAGLPNEWRIYIRNLQDQKNVGLQCLKDHFMRWMERRIRLGEDGKYDRTWDRMSRLLFPYADQVALANLFILFSRLYRNPKLAIKRAVEKRRPFGRSSMIAMRRMMQDDSEAEKERKMGQRRKYTLRTILYLYRTDNLRDIIEQLLKATKKLKEEEPHSAEFPWWEFRRRQIRYDLYIGYLGDMLAILREEPDLFDSREE